MIAQRKPNNDKGFKDFRANFVELDAFRAAFAPREPALPRLGRSPHAVSLDFANARRDGAFAAVRRIFAAFFFCFA
ncbi:hypothetical protein [Burkholderia humptydooensis]|uniref:hypothetical protein n=1 Tax=Burkholderia humptydooensis TaxID=430531 RepID=UPI0005BC5995|nr:hypothetical protein [Burkholderia humptydooensis]